jgi:hypothetical protein
MEEIIFFQKAFCVMWSVAISFKWQVDLGSSHEFKARLQWKQGVQEPLVEVGWGGCVCEGPKTIGSQLGEG